MDAERLRVRSWSAPATALCLLVDRSGSMGGKPLATAAIAAAAVALRGPADYSVLAFSKDIVAVKSQGADKAGEQVVTEVLALRGLGTTDLAGALRAAGEQLGRSRASRKIAVVLSDCRSTVAGDVFAAARALPELVVVAPGRAIVRRRSASLGTAGRRSQRSPGRRWLPRRWRRCSNADQHSTVGSGTIADGGTFDSGAVSTAAAATVALGTVVDGGTDVTAGGTGDFTVVLVLLSVVVVIVAAAGSRSWWCPRRPARVRRRAARCRGRCQGSPACSSNPCARSARHCR